MSTYADIFSGKKRTWVTRLVPLLVLLALIVAFGIANSRFLTVQNAINILQQSSVLMMVAFGVTFVIMAGSIDLSIGSIVAFSGVIAASAAPQFGVFALVIGVLAGLGAGLINGVIFAY